MDHEAAKLIGAGLAAIGVLGGGIGVGQVWAQYMNAVARNGAFPRIPNWFRRKAA